MAGTIRERLTTAVAQLKEAGHYDSAAAVEAVLAPRGARLLEERRASASSLTITLNSGLKVALVAAAEEFGVVFSGLAEEAYQAVQNGWVPPKPVRTPGPSTVLNVKVDDQLRQPVREMLPRLTEEHGYRISEGHLVLSFMCDQLGIERPNTGERESLDMRLPKSLVQYWESRAAEEGVTLQQVVEERIPAVVDGSWTPSPNRYMADAKSRKRVADEKRPGYTIWASASSERWSEDARQRLWLPIDKDLLEELRAKTDALTKELGFLVYPGAVVRAILTDRFGEPAA
ncbi:hypothetical protein [Streptomyces griseofuscus]|uniref:hypothetical protein n=1 Tax=Streptomyces griseofuscus TaxID=146922 RepID=UPI0036BFB8B8